MPADDKSRILIAIAEQTAVNFFQAALSDQGYLLETAASGREIMTKIASFMPDLILLAAVLPDMTGYEVTERIKSDPSTSSISIILLTEQGSVEDKVRGLEAGADDFLVKPFILEELLVRVRSLVKLKKLQDRLHAAGHSDTAVPDGTSGAIGRLEQGCKPSLVLIIEDDPHITHIFSTILHNGGHQVMVARDGSEADSMIEGSVPNLIILDLMLPGINGMEWMQQLKANTAYSEIPVIIVTAVADMETKIKGLNLGADDYLIKPVDTMELLARVNANLRKYQAEQRLKVWVDDEFKQLVYDPLTGLHNRRYLESLMQRDAALSRQKGLPLTMLMIDIDHFRAVVDASGQEAGDLVLRAVAGMLKAELRGSDLAVLYGVNVFTVTLYGSNANQAIIIADRLRRNAQQMAVAGLDGVKLTVSIGVSEFAPSDTDLKAVLKRAELAMQIAKSSGRNRVVSQPTETP